LKPLCLTEEMRSVRMTGSPGQTGIMGDTGSDIS
jgi:hypothetical protein